MSIYTWDQCVVIGKQMLELANDELWDECEDLEVEWGLAVRHCFEAHDLSKQQIRQLLGVNEEIMQLMKNRQNMIKLKLNGFNKGRRAVKAYNGY